MTYQITQYHHDRIADTATSEFDTLDAARAATAELLGCELTDDMRGACPDEDTDNLSGVECWMPYIDDDHIPDGTVFIYRVA